MVKPLLIDLEAVRLATGRKQEKSVQRERLSEGAQMFCVYWIRLENHSNPLTEGYVGITRNLTERIRAHKKNRRKTPFTCAIHKYGWDSLIVEVLHENLSLQEALSTEEDLRPSRRIGWNCQKGGELGVEASWYDDDSNRDKHRNATSTATKIGIALNDTVEARRIRGKESWVLNRESYKDISKGSRNPRAILTEDQVREIKSLLQVMTTRQLADKFDVKIYVIQQIKSGKNWSHV